MPQCDSLPRNGVLTVSMPISVPHIPQKLMLTMMSSASIQWGSGVVSIEAVHGP